MPNAVTAASSKDYFEKDGKPFFYLADTCWRAFDGPSFEEWDEYLDIRAAQGFTVVQVSALTRHFGNKSEGSFLSTADGQFDFSRINDAYFDRAEELVAMAGKRNITVALVALWHNYVPDTWGGDGSSFQKMPIEAVRTYVEYLVEHFDRYHPIYLLGGDTDFPTATSIRYYTEAMAAVRRKSPLSLISCHTWADFPDIPAELAESPEFDFYMYQSGHWHDRQDLAYRHAETLRKGYPRRPIVNGEPCYEGMKGGEATSRRFSAFDVRKAIWQSLLAGANAGVTYGAHGLWSWYNKGDPYPFADFVGPPYHWRTALSLPGAWDAGFAGWVIDRFDLFTVKPTSLVTSTSSEVKASSSEERIVAYVPYNASITIDTDIAAYEWTLIDLAQRRFGRPRFARGNELEFVDLPGFHADVLLIGQRR